MKDPHRDEEEIGEYRSKDLEFGQTEGYEPEYPLASGEELLLQLNKTDKERRAIIRGHQATPGEHVHDPGEREGISRRA